MAGDGQLGQHRGLQRFSAGCRNAGQQPGNVLAIRQGQLQHGHAVLEFGWQAPFRGGDHQGVGALPEFGGEVAQAPADARIIAVTVEILQEQDRALLHRHGAQQVEGRHGVSVRFALAPRGSAQAADEVPAEQPPAPQSLGRPLQQDLNPFLLQAADPEDRRA